MPTTSLWDIPVSPVAWSVVVVTSLAAAVIDIRSRRIPNWLTGPVLLAGLVWATWRGGMTGAGDAVGGCLILAVPYVLLFVLAGGGAGDAKLMGALGAWLGVHGGTVVLVAVGLSGVVLAVGYAIARRYVGPMLANMKSIAWTGMFVIGRCGSLCDSRHLLPERRQMLKMPYGVAIFTGVCLAAGVRLLWCT